MPCGKPAPVRQVELSLYRPFLSSSELGAMIQGPLSGLHDVFFRILGLEILRDTDKTALALTKSLNVFSTG